MIVSLIKVSALAAALLCVGAVKPMSNNGPFKHRASRSLPDFSVGSISAARRPLSRRPPPPASNRSTSDVFER
jgi:hypothetical protein